MPFPYRPGRHRRCHRSMQFSLSGEPALLVAVVDVVAIRCRVAGQRQGLVAPTSTSTPTTFTPIGTVSRSQRSASSFARALSVELETAVVVSVAAVDRRTRRIGSPRRNIGKEPADIAVVVLAVVIAVVAVAVALALALALALAVAVEEGGGGGGGGGGGDSPPRCTRCRTERHSRQTQVETREGPGRRLFSQHRSIPVDQRPDQINDLNCPPLASSLDTEQDPCYRPIYS